MRTAIRAHVGRELARRHWRRTLVERGIAGAFIAIPGVPIPPRLRRISAMMFVGASTCSNFVPVTNTMTASGTQTVPANASVCFVEGFGESGSGGNGAGTGCTKAGGGGGGSGSYGAVNFAVAGQAGHTWTVTIGTGASSTNTTIAAGTMTGWTTLLCHFGVTGATASSGTSPGAGGAGGAAGTGGSTNTAGNAGSNGTTVAGGAGATGLTGVNGNGLAGGHGGYGNTNTGLTGGNTGKAIFAYT